MSRTLDDLLLPEEYREARARRRAGRHRADDRLRIGPRHATITHAEAFLTGVEQGIRGGLAAALARDVPTSTPVEAVHFQRIWRAS